MLIFSGAGGGGGKWKETEREKGNLDAISTESDAERGISVPRPVSLWGQKAKGSTSIGGGFRTERKKGRKEGGPRQSSAWPLGKKRGFVGRRGGAQTLRRLGLPADKFNMLRITVLSRTKGRKGEREKK